MAQPPKGLDIAGWLILSALIIALSFLIPYCVRTVQRRYKKSSIVYTSESDVESQRLKAENPDKDCTHDCCPKPRPLWATLKVALGLLTSYFIIIVILAIVGKLNARGILLKGEPATACTNTTFVDDCNYADPEPLYNVHYQDHFFTSRGLRLHGILMVNDTFAPEDVGKPYVNIFHSHGTARNLAVNYRWVRYAFMLKQGGVRIFTYDYPGFGKSDGSPSEIGVTTAALDAFATFSALLAPEEVDRVSYWGHSLGGGVTAWLAKQRKPHSIMIQSSFNDLKSVLTNAFPIAGWALRRTIPVQLDSVANLEGYDHCYYQFHARDDPTVPFSLGKDLWDSMTDVPEAPAGCKTGVFVDKGKHVEPIESTVEATALPAFVRFIRNLPTVYSV